MEADPVRLLSAAALLETTIVIAARFGDAGLGPLDRLIVSAGIEIVAVDVEQARAGRDGWLAYGKGRHPAGLNYGGCFAYALAKVSGEPLLYKGADFAKSGIRSVSW